MKLCFRTMEGVCVSLVCWEDDKHNERVGGASQTTQGVVVVVVVAGQGQEREQLSDHGKITRSRHTAQLNAMQRLGKCVLSRSSST